MWSGPTFSVISLKVAKNVCLMHILHFKMSISASKCAIIISNIHLLMYLSWPENQGILFFYISKTVQMIRISFMASLLNAVL